MNEDKNGILNPFDKMTFRLDTVDTDTNVPSFYISHMGNFMYNAKDSAEYYNDGTASAEGNRMYKLVDENAAQDVFKKKEEQREKRRENRIRKVHR